MAEAAQGYHDTPAEDRKKAKAFFDRGRTVADTGNFEYAIEMYMQGLALDPEEIDAHKSLREISLKRKASGGKDLGMLEKMKFSKVTRDDRANMLNAEKLLAYDPGNTERMVQILQNAHRGGFYETVLWVGPILLRANADAKKPEFSKFRILIDVYRYLNQWKLATEACQYAMRLRPGDMDLQTELKNLGAQDTMHAGGYGTSRSFRDSIRDAEGQEKIRETDRDVRSMDSMTRAIVEAEADWKTAPEDLVKLNKFADALIFTEQTENENRAIELLDDAFQKTKQFRFRLKAGSIKLKQLTRMERAMRAELEKAPSDAELKQDYVSFVKEKAEEELKEFTLYAENYPTNSDYRFERGIRLFLLHNYQEAIPVFQLVRQDPKYRIRAAIYLGRAFLEAGFPDEAADTLKVAIEENPARDQSTLLVYYWYGRALESKGDTAAAVKSYSQVAQINFNYLDVQSRIKNLRTAAGA